MTTKRQWSSSRVLLLAGLVVAGLLALAAWREYHNRQQLTLERGRALEATEQAKMQKSAAILAAEVAELARLQAEQAHRANAEIRGELAGDRDRYRRLYEEAERRRQASEQQHRDQVAAIPTLDDVELAAATVKQLETIYRPDVKLFLTSTPESLFHANRPTVQFSLQAGLDVGYLRRVEATQKDQLASQAGEIENWKAEVRTWSDDLNIEMAARDKAEASASEWKDSSDTFERANQHWVEVDKARVRKDRWGAVEDILITGGIAGLGALSGNEIGYGIAGGAVGSWVIRRVF